MDEAVRWLVREIALGGLSGVPLFELWEHYSHEMKLRSEELLPFALDEWTKGALWGELLHSNHLSHFQTSTDVPEYPLLDLSTIVSDTESQQERT